MGRWAAEGYWRLVHLLSIAFVDLRFAKLDPHANVSCQNVRIWPALKKKLRIWPYQCCSDMIKIHNTRHYAWHNSNLIVQLKEFICTECRCTTAHCTLLTVTVWQGWLKCIIAASTGPEDYQLNTLVSVGSKLNFSGSLYGVVSTDSVETGLFYKHLCFNWNPPSFSSTNVFTISHT